MKNKWCDLNNHLFAQLERLSDESLSGDALKEEIVRARAVADVSRQVIDCGKLILDATKFKQEYSLSGINLPMIGGDK